MIFFTTSKILTYDVGGYFFEWFSWEFRQHKAAESSGLSSGAGVIWRIRSHSKNTSWFLKSPNWWFPITYQWRFYENVPVLGYKIGDFENIFEWNIW